jgi:hypothetical protein
MSRQYKQLGEEVWKNRVDKINAELFALTYGSLVAQLVKDYEDFAEVNKQLEKMGYNIGVRLVEDFLARAPMPRCADFRETAEAVSKVGFKMFLNITPIVGAWSPDAREFSLTLDENPLAEFVELPDDASRILWYSNILCGVLRGALEMVCLVYIPFIIPLCSHPTRDNRSRCKSIAISSPTSSAEMTPPRSA